MPIHRIRRISLPQIILVLHSFSEGGSGTHLLTDYETEKNYRGMLKKLTFPFSMLLYAALIITTEGEHKMTLDELKKIIWDSNLHAEVKSYEDSSKIVFLAFPGKEKYKKVLHFRVKPIKNGSEISITFEDYGRFNLEKNKINSSFTIPKDNGTIVYILKNELNTLRDQVRKQSWCPDDCRAENKKDGDTKTPTANATETETSKQTSTIKSSKENNKQEIDISQQIKGVPNNLNDAGEEDGFWTKEKNPWVSFKLKKDQVLFVLDDDAEKIEAYNQRNEGKNNYIHLDAPPQPYIGNPYAQIWLLTMNPSYSEMDIFDLVDEEAGMDKARQVFPNATFNTGMFENRRTLINAQYSFDFPEKKDPFDLPEFYVLDKNFNTVKHEGNKKFGSYEWWNNFLFEKNICSPDGVNPDDLEACRENLKKFFVLESFPYHSEGFSGINPKKLSKSHFEFWEKMVRWALRDTDRIFLCRGKDIAKRVADMADEINQKNDAREKQIFVSVNQDFSVSTDNFISLETVEKIENLKNESKKDFRKIIFPEEK